MRNKEERVGNTVHAEGIELVCERACRVWGGLGWSGGWSTGDGGRIGAVRYLPNGIYLLLTFFRQR